jgi:hypothetical protein
MTRGLTATPLAVWERDGVKAALVKAGLPADDILEERVLVWRFETVQAIPVGSAPWKFSAAMRCCGRW